jgi:bile acid:Na+ symporter, BASS family
MSGIARTAALLLAMVLGVFLPQAHALAGAIRWLVMAMLLIVFLQVRLSRQAIHRTHAFLLLANVGMGFAAWYVAGLVGGHNLGLAAFFAAITPTATAAPVIISFLRGRVDYVVAAFLITNLAIAALLPLMLPVVLGQATPEAFAAVSRGVGLVVFVPLLIAWLMRRIYPAAASWPARLRNVTFGMWIVVLFLITTNASHFLRNQIDAPWRVVGQIAATSLVICAVNFSLGYLIGGRDFRREASQSLGQKNTAFTIYLALTYASPVVALGPTCYVLWHNLWNSWQLHRDAHGAAKVTGNK